MNKIVKIHLILATIFSINCNSWSTNLNKDINSINEANLNNNINTSEVDLNNINVDKLSSEQCEKIFNEKSEQFQENLNKVYITFCNSHIKLCNLIYEEHSKLIEEFLDKYSRYDNKYITISNKNISSFERIADLIDYKNELNIGDRIKCTQLLQDIRNKAYYYIQQYIIMCGEKENDIIQQVENIKENRTNSEKIRKEYCISEIEKCYKDNPKIYFSFFKRVRQPFSITDPYMLIGAISRHFDNFHENFEFLSDIEELLQKIINYDIIPFDERNNRKIDLRYFDSYEAPSGFKSKAVGFKYYNLTDNFRYMLFKITKYHWDFNHLKWKQQDKTFEQKLLLLCSNKRYINNYIKEVIDTLDTKKIAVLHKDGEYVSKVLKVTQSLKKSLENIEHDAKQNVNKRRKKMRY